MPFCPLCNIGLDYYQMKAKHCNNCSHDWEIFYVLPVNDIKEHRESYICPCLPEIKYESGNMIVVHNSFDGREGLEWVNEILKN
ncbi:MAG: hypothetical protein ABI091_20170 [Ferruginibacter sp.]